VREEATSIVEYLNRPELKSLPEAGLTSSKAVAMIQALEDLTLSDPDNIASPRVVENHVRRLTMLEDPVKQRARALQLGKEALEKKAPELKTYIAQISRKLPIPKNFMKHEKLLKTMTLEFVW